MGDRRIGAESDAHDRSGSVKMAGDVLGQDDRGLDGGAGEGRKGGHPEGLRERFMQGGQRGVRCGLETFADLSPVDGGDQAQPTFPR